MFASFALKTTSCADLVHSHDQALDQLWVWMWDYTLVCLHVCVLLCVAVWTGYYNNIFIDTVCVVSKWWIPIWQNQHTFFENITIEKQYPKISNCWLTGDAGRNHMKLAVQVILKPSTRWLYYIIIYNNNKHCAYIPLPTDHMASPISTIWLPYKFNKIQYTKHHDNDISMFPLYMALLRLPVAW